LSCTNTVAVLVSACLAGGLAGCAPTAKAPAADHTSDVAAITALDNQDVAYIVAHQYEKFGATYAADGISVSPGAPVAQGPQAIAKSFAPFANDPAYDFKFTLNRVEVSKDGSMAYDVWRYDQTSTDSKTHKVVHEIGSGMDALRKGDDGTWKFVASINTPSPDAPGTVAAPATTKP